MEGEGAAGGRLCVSSVGATTDVDSADPSLDTLPVSGSGGVSADRLCDVVPVPIVGWRVGASVEESPGGSFEGVTSSASVSNCSLCILAVRRKNNRPSNDYTGL